MLHSFAAWLETTALSQLVTKYPWVWPASETLHFIGLALLVGVTGLFDLRLLGFMRTLPVGPLNALMPWAVAGFVINLITGALFFVGEPLQYVDNIAFQLKMLFILVAGANVLVWRRFARRRALALGPHDEAPPVAKAVALVSLVCWIAVMYWGRMLPFIGNAF